MRNVEIEHCPLNVNCCKYYTPREISDLPSVMSVTSIDENASYRN